MRFILVVALQIASPVWAQVEQFVCETNGFGERPQITVRHDPDNDSLQFDDNYSFAGQNNPDTPIPDRGAESLWFKTKLQQETKKTTYNVYLYDTWILIETIELPVLDQPCTPMTCEEQQTIYRLGPCTLAD